MYLTDRENNSSIPQKHRNDGQIDV
jgi:hypothetical protein